MRLKVPVRDLDEGGLGISGAASRFYRALAGKISGEWRNKSGLMT